MKLSLSTIFGFLLVAALNPTMGFGTTPTSPEAALDTSDGNSGDPLLRWGLLDVRRYGARPDDEIDDTAALQRAIDDARDRGLVAYFPGGVYLISDTLRVMQRVKFNTKKGRWIHDRREANALTGSATGRRATLKLVEGSSGFENPARPKPLVWIWSQPREEGKPGSPLPQHEQPNISFNQVFKGIDIDVRGRGNAGAVGIRHAGSQGSTIEDVNILAEGAFAGIYNPPGQGGGVYKVVVDGGRYGVWADHRARYPVLAGVTLRNQEREAIFWKGQSNLTLAGFLIEKSTRGPVLELQSGRKAHNRALTLVDGIIRGKGKIAIDNREGRSLYMNGVYFAGYEQAVRSGVQPPISGGTTHPLMMKEYTYVGRGSEAVIGARASGSNVESALHRAVAHIPASAQLIARHLWSASFASFEDADAVNITDFGARADDGVDDTAAIQAALDRHHKVFVPKGTFVITDTLRLNTDNQLFGVAKHLSVIRAGTDWRGEPGRPLITTVDDPSARTTLSFLLIERPHGLPSAPLLEWRAGAGSVVRDIMGGVSRDRIEKVPTSSSAGFRGTYAIRGNGGGRWYGLAAEWNRMKRDTSEPGYRHLVIEGTRQPLAMYGVNIERGLSDPQIEIVDADKVTIYYLKSETLEHQGERAGVLQINDSRNIALFGYSGNARPSGRAIIQVADSQDVILANITPVRPDKTFDTVSVQVGSNLVTINGVFPVTLVRLGTPHLAFQDSERPHAKSPKDPKDINRTAHRSVLDLETPPLSVRPL